MNILVEVEKKRKLKPLSKWEKGFVVVGVFYLGVFFSNLAHHGANLRYYTEQSEREDISREVRERYERQAASELDLMISPRILNPYARADIESKLEHIYRQSESPLIK